MAKQTPQAGGASRQLVTVQQKAENLRAFLIPRKAELAAALPRHLSADKMLRLSLTACARNPKLLDCSPNSFFGAVLAASQLGLEIDLLGHGYLVPFFNSKAGRFEAQFMPGYQGLLALARRSGEIAKVDAQVVHQGDSFRYAYGLKPVLEHTPCDKPGALTHVYAVAWLTHHAEPQWRVMNREEIETKHRARSRAATSGPWVTDYEAMCLKTVLRALCKLLPASIELQTAVHLDEAVEAGLSQELTILEEPGPPAAPAAAEKLPDPPTVQAPTAEEAKEARDLWESTAAAAAPREPGQEG